MEIASHFSIGSRVYIINSPAIPAAELYDL
jgi:hypothetical protein